MRCPPILLTSKTDPGRANRLLTTAVRARLREDPLALLRHAPFHAWKLWRPIPYFRQGYTVDYGAVFWIGLLSDGWLIPLGLAGALWLFLRRASLPDPALPALGLLWILTLTAAHAMSFAMTRHRLPVMGYILLSASALLVEGWQRWCQRREAWREEIG